MKKKQTVRRGKQSSKALYFNQKLELCYLSNLLKTVKHDRFSRKNYPDFANNIELCPKVGDGEIRRRFEVA